MCSHDTHRSQRTGKSNRTGKSRLKRREFVKQSTVAASAVAASRAESAVLASGQGATAIGTALYRFDDPDSLCHGSGWESLNPGYWQIKGKALRRRLVNVGDRARSTGFPFHERNAGKKLETSYDPSLPEGILYRRDWKMEKDFSIQASFVYLADRGRPNSSDDPAWKMYQDGYAAFGLALGAKSIFESYNKIRHAIQLVWTDDGKFQFVFSGGKGKQGTSERPANPERVDAPTLRRGDKLTIRAHTQRVSDGLTRLTGTLELGGKQFTISTELPSAWVQGFVGLTAKGLVDFEVSDFQVDAQSDRMLPVGPIECYSCYALGDSLKQVDGKWQVRFVSLFDTDGSTAEIRIATQEQPSGGWGNVPVAGTAQIVNHRWRRNTAVILATLPVNPATTTLYYTIWKDGKNVTADTRVGTASTGAGTGLVGDVPSSGQYVGRLPKLAAPYKLCGLSCHAITSGLQQRTANGLQILGGGDEWQFRDQPTVEAYKHLDEYHFQVMVWEDDVWYMELVLYPPSTDDAYKIVKHSICGPTSRWQMMRHWNIINPGDHDYGMDDVKGPEQIAIRRVEGLGQDTSYMKRNFQIVHHLITGDEDVDPLANPKKWRAWKMPNRDFTFVILDSRLWRSSQDTDMWDDSGWDNFQNLYDRTDPTRSLLGEEQFAWLQRLLQTDSSPLICLTGINGLHTIWAGVDPNGVGSGAMTGPFDQRDRVAADYAGWVKAGADRVLELLGSRDGVVSVYGDVHNGCIMKNVDQRVIECSFGPIGRSGGRSVIPGFGRKMKDFDGREVEIHALYHSTHANPDLAPQPDGAPFYWNFLEMEFDPHARQQNIGLRVRNMMDPPSEQPRGGGELLVSTSDTGRAISSRIPRITTLKNADVRFDSLDGNPIRATRSDDRGEVAVPGLVDIPPGTKLILTAHNGQEVDSQFIQSQPV